jgi:hypothetical protein
MSIVGSRESDGWEMKVLGPNGFERSYTLAGNAGEHQPLANRKRAAEIATGADAAGVKESCNHEVMCEKDGAA